VPNVSSLHYACGLAREFREEGALRHKVLHQRFPKIRIGRGKTVETLNGNWAFPNQVFGSINDRKTALTDDFFEPVFAVQNLPYHSDRIVRCEGH
jgi:hypothetical protein